MTDYQHKSVIKLAELYEQHKKEMGSGFGFMAMMWKAISPEVPIILGQLDKSPELIAKMKTFFETLVTAMREDTEKAVEVTGELVKFEDKIEGGKRGSS